MTPWCERPDSRSGSRVPQNCLVALITLGGASLSQVQDEILPPPLPVASAELKSPWRIWHFIAAYIVGFFTSVAGLVVGLIVAGGFEGLVKDAELPADALLAFSVPAQLIGNVLALVGIGIAFKIALQSSLGFVVRPKDGWFIPFGAAVSIIIGMLFTPLADALGADADPQSTAELITSVSPGLALMVTFFSIVVFVPMVEEVLFRGVLQRAIGNYLGRVSTILVTGVVFGVSHVLGLANPTFANVIVVIVPLVLLGILLSWIADHDGRLGRAIAMHTGINALAFIATQMELPI